MSKIGLQDLKDLGFVAEMFQGQTLAGFDAYLQRLIDEQADLLEGRIGETRYAATAKPMADYVRRAEKALAVSELWDRRINTKLAQAKANSETKVDCAYEEKQRNHWRKTADLLIDEKIVKDATTDSGSDFAGGTLVTEHYPCWH